MSYKIIFVVIKILQRLREGKGHVGTLEMKKEFYPFFVFKPFLSWCLSINANLALHYAHSTYLLSKLRVLVNVLHLVAGVEVRLLISTTAHHGDVALKRTTQPAPALQRRKDIFVAEKKKNDPNKILGCDGEGKQSTSS